MDTRDAEVDTEWSHRAFISVEQCFLYMHTPWNHPKSLLKCNLLGPTPCVSDWFQNFWVGSRISVSNIPMCCWCCWSWDHSLGTALLKESNAVYPLDFQLAYPPLTHAHCRTLFVIISSSKNAFCKCNLVCGTRKLYSCLSIYQEI